MGRTIAICGNGAGAAILLRQLTERLREPVAIRVIGSGPALGAGIAYSTDNPNHVLNVPAGRMSADPDLPHHFGDWLGAHGVNATRWQDQFVSRSLYRKYLREIAAPAICRNPEIDAQIVRGEVKSLIKQGAGWIVGYDKESLFADMVVIATGNDLPAPLAHRFSPEVAARVIDDPWNLPEIDRSEDLLILGTGLTAVDAVVGLLDHGHRGGITLLSRHGLLPHAHVQPRMSAVLAPPWPRNALQLLMALRHAVGPSPQAETWQGFVDAMRPHLAEIWQGLPLGEKLRALRHGATLWNIHRHRIAPEVGARLATAARRNEFSVMPGRLAGLQLQANGRLMAAIQRKGTQSQVTADRVINCTGPNSDPLKSHNELIENIIASRQARASDCGLGLDVDQTNRVLDSEGRAHPSLFAMGALTRARWWEITAIPEIAAQSVSIARSVLGQIGRLDQSQYA